MARHNPAAKPAEHKGMGFKAAEANVGPGYNAGAVIAAASRGASKAAKKANPNLKKVKG
jgi:hypothetical protein